MKEASWQKEGTRNKRIRSRRAKRIDRRNTRRKKIIQSKRREKNNPRVHKEEN